MKALALALLLAIASLQSLAQPAAVIEAVQTPAWLERDAERVPLVPGMELRAGDRIVSGNGARVLVRLTEGSVVKLGENGTLRLAELQPSQELFKAALQVLQGAFRFTTDIVGKGRRRDVSVRVEQAVTMDKPRQFYQRDKGKTQPVGFVDAGQFAKWSQETEIEAGKGALRRGGRFSVQLAAADKEEAARAVRDQVRAAGYPAELARRKEADKLCFSSPGSPSPRWRRHKPGRRSRCASSCLSRPAARPTLPRAPFRTGCRARSGWGCSRRAALAPRS